jgi:phosphoglycolate phosphatase
MSDREGIGRVVDRPRDGGNGAPGRRSGVSAELLLFDLDGTLADTKTDLATAVNLAFWDMGLPMLELEVIAGYVGDGVRKLIEKTLGESGTPRYQEALRLFRGHYLGHLLDTTRFYPGMEALLQRLSNKKKVVVTNKPMEYTEMIIDGLNAGRYFDLVIGSDHTTPLKPDPYMVRSALERIRMTPELAVMVGDGVNDILAARAASVRSCAVGYGLSPAPILHAAGPDYFCLGVPELMSLLCDELG